MSVVVVSAFDGDPYELMKTVDECGEVSVVLMGDEVLRSRFGHELQFTEKERRYVAESIRGVGSVSVTDEVSEEMWTFLSVLKIDGAIDLQIYVEKFLDTSTSLMMATPARKSGHRAVVTGCFDYLHSGHVRFFEEAAEYGELHVVVGSDANVRMLKGPGLPMFPEDRRRYMVSRLKTVAGAYVSSGEGWMDAEPEIAEIQPRYYVVNEDGDREEKRAFCETRGIEYVVLKREPRAGLPARSSTELRGL